MKRSVSRGLAAGKDKERHKYDFSFSGLKTAVARYIEGTRERGEDIHQRISAQVSLRQSTIP